MGFRGARHFGAKQPNKMQHLVEFKMLLANVRTLDMLSSVPALAHRFRLDAKEVEYQIGVERRRRAEAGLV